MNITKVGDRLQVVLTPEEFSSQFRRGVWPSSNPPDSVVVMGNAFGWATPSRGEFTVSGMTITWESPEPHISWTFPNYHRVAGEIVPVRRFPWMRGAV
jgi:hypothetical protein